ncbi:uncharacterized protein LOC114729175 [Neltuma alba]|uniref:uncharacterized protein LOC114729175 n=1 Tax=Neltuma alba TaxID=207710 RepID=UPI0010A33D77|nr:uncharacterized protein LOC114729175 [Prosopis alba]
MPKYAKFIKDVLSKKRRFTEYETVAVTKSFTDVIKQILSKQKDSGSFSIPCHIGNKLLGQGLCDLGASVNLMPISVFNKLELGEARPTTVTLQPADQTDKEMPLLLGRPFLATARTLIDVEKGELTLRVDDEDVTFNMYHLMKASSRREQCSFIDIIDQIVQ